MDYSSNDELDLEIEEEVKARGIKTEPESSGKISGETEALMGQANQHFIFHEYDQAVEILHEIVRRAPNMPDPFHVLGLICGNFYTEDRKEYEKAANFYMLAAQLTQHDVSLWLKVAYMFKDLGHLKEAIYSFGRALLNKKTPDSEILKEKAVCYELLGAYKKAAKTYFKIIKQEPKCDPHIIKALVEVYNIMEQPRKAIALLQSILEDRYDENVLNILCELFLHVKDYEDCLKLFSKFPDQIFPLDIEVKRAIAFIRCGNKKEGMPVFEKLLGNSVRHYPDLYYLSGCLFYDIGEFEYSLKFLENLRVLDTYDKPELWLKCGDLYCKIKDFTSAEDALTSVLVSEHKELHTEAKLKLAQLYKDAGNVTRSIEILHLVNLPHADNLDHDILSQVAQNDILLKIEEVEILLDQKSNLPEVIEFLKYIIDIENKSQITLKHEGVVKFIGEFRFNSIIMKCIDLLMNSQDFDEARKLIKNLLSISACKKEEVRLYLKQKLTRCCIEVKEYEEALGAFKFICEKNDTEENWVILNCLAKKCTNHSQLRGWLSKISARKPNNRSIRMLLGNNYLQTGYFSLAIKQYSTLYEEDSDNSLVNLDLGLCYLLSLGSRTSQNKTGLYAKAFFHIKKYVRIRKKSHYCEAYYNLGRAFHHLSYLHKATGYYDKVMNYVARSLIYTGETSTFKVHMKYARMSAQNLASIYKSLNENNRAEEMQDAWL